MRVSCMLFILSLINKNDLFGQIDFFWNKFIIYKGMVIFNEVIKEMVYVYDFILIDNLLCD